MQIGDLVKCLMHSEELPRESTGVIIDMTEFSGEYGPGVSVYVQWTNEGLWYHDWELEVINEIR